MLLPVPIGFPIAIADDWLAPPALGLAAILVRSGLLHDRIRCSTNRPSGVADWMPSTGHAKACLRTSRRSVSRHEHCLLDEGSSWGGTTGFHARCYRAAGRRWSRERRLHGSPHPKEDSITCLSESASELRSDAGDRTRTGREG